MGGGGGGGGGVGVWGVGGGGLGGLGGGKGGGGAGLRRVCEVANKRARLIGRGKTRGERERGRDHEESCLKNRTKK